jgi:hypothetical protein
MSDTIIGEDIRDCDRMIAEIDAALSDDAEEFIDRPGNNLDSPKPSDNIVDPQNEEVLGMLPPEGLLYIPEFVC